MQSLVVAEIHLAEIARLLHEFLLARKAHGVKRRVGAPLEITSMHLVKKLLMLLENGILLKCLL